MDFLDHNWFTEARKQVHSQLRLTDRLVPKVGQGVGSPLAARAVHIV